jgi:hypothetical protein
MVCLTSGAGYPVSDPEALASKALEHFKEFDDPDLKCMVSNDY